MGTSFVSINDKGFWMRDSVLELWLRLLVLHIEDPSEAGGGVRQIRDQWLLASRVHFNGCVPVCLEEAVSTEEGHDIVVQAINSLLDALAKSPEILDHRVLNLLGFHNPWEKDVASWRLTEVGNAFLDLIAGKIKSDARSTEFMPGCRDAPHKLS
jgi:hypothetical protein